MKKIICLGLWFFLGALSPPLYADVNLEQAQQIVEHAATRYEESRSRGHAWQKTRLHLERARTALQSGDYPLAVSEADRSIALADASLVQADAESTGWRSRFPSAQ